jgi:hypothetical protein
MIDNKPKIIEPIMEPIIIDEFSDSGDGIDDCNDDVDGVNDVDGDDGGDGGGDSSKMFVHLNSLLLLISSNKISLSFNWS